MNSLHYLMNRGAMKSSDYQYTGKNQDCAYNSAKKIWQVENCTKVPSDLNSLKSTLLNQPVIVGFDTVTDPAFHQFGGSGIFTASDKCGKTINHYMLAVGWG